MKEIGEINNDWRFEKYEISNESNLELIEIGASYYIYLDIEINAYIIRFNYDKAYKMSTTNIDTLNDIKDITYNQESEILVIQSKDNRFFIFDENLKPIRLKVIPNE